jgi:hypothetical protein
MTVEQTAPTLQAPGPQGLLVVGSLFHLQRQGILGFWTDAWREHGDVVQARMGPMMKRSGNGAYAELAQAVASATESTYGPGRGSDP